MHIEKAQPEDHIELTRITFASKAHWGYPTTQMEMWREVLTITESHISRQIVRKLVDQQKIAGYYSLLEHNPELVEMDFLFVSPECIGQGFGKLLIADAVRVAKNLGYGRMTVDADPNAQKFYEKCGFELVSQKQSTIKGRLLPILEKSLTNV